MNEGDDEYSKALRSDVRRSRREEAAAIAELQRRLQELTPRIPATTALMVLNVTIFVVMVATGVHPADPTVESLIGWGANYGPLTAGGQWWRLFTSMFLHVGVFHLAMNMWALLSLGRLVERVLGTAAFLVAYLLAGWAGALVSVVLKPFTVSAGASGAIFGVYGVLLAFILRPTRSIPVGALRPLRNSAFVFIAFNLWIGLTNARIDLAAHLGGFAGGLVCGAVLGHELSLEARKAIRGRAAALVSIGGTALAAATWTLQGRIPDLIGTYREYDAVESRVIAAFNAAARKSRDGELSDDGFADALERDVLPPWRAVGTKLSGLRNVPREQQPILHRLEQYWRLREEAWELMAHGARSHDAGEIERANAKEAEARAMADKIRKP